jgi:hypothetical protein
MHARVVANQIRSGTTDEWPIAELRAVLTGPAARGVRELRVVAWP